MQIACERTCCVMPSVLPDARAAETCTERAPAFLGSGNVGSPQKVEARLYHTHVTVGWSRSETDQPIDARRPAARRKNLPIPIDVYNPSAAAQWGSLSAANFTSASPK